MKNLVPDFGIRHLWGELQFGLSTIKIMMCATVPQLITFLTNVPRVLVTHKLLWSLTNAGTFHVLLTLQGQHFHIFLNIDQFLTR